MDFLTTRDGLNYVNDTVQRRNGMPSDDVSEGSKANEATRNENSDWPDSAVYPKLQEQIWPHSTKIRKIEATFTEMNPSNENDAQSPSKVSDDVIVPETFEQSKDTILKSKLKSKLLHEEYSESILQQDARYRHYTNNLERFMVKEHILTRQYSDETGNVKYYRILFPQHLLQ